jgi:hypothetical protein
MGGLAPPGQHRGGSGSAVWRTVRDQGTVSAAAAEGPEAPGQPAPVRPVSTAGGLGGSSPRLSTAAKIAATAGFVRDVRDGMAEYLELHHRELARNLGSRSNRTSSG